MRINGREMSPQAAAKLAHTGKISVPLTGAGSKRELGAYYRELNLLQAPKTEAEQRAHMRQLAGLNTLLRDMVQALVRDVEAVQVHTALSNGLYAFTVHCADEDIGLILGRRHLTYHALKRLLQAAGHRIGVASDLRIAGYQQSEGRLQPPE